MHKQRVIILLLILLLTLGAAPAAAGEHPPAPSAPRWQLPQVPPCEEQPEAIVCEVAWDWESVPALDQLAENTERVWLEDDALLIAYRKQADMVFVDGAIQTLLKPLSVEDTWGIAVQLKGFSTAIVSYYLIPFYGEEPDLDDVTQGVWRGADASQPQHADPLRGTLATYQLNSQYLAASRKAIVYLPPGHDWETVIPVVYMADGQSVPEYAAVIEPLIVDGTLPPLLLVGIFSADQSEAIGPLDDPRKAEYIGYISGSTPDERFLAHEQFFLDEVIPWAEESFGATTDREGRTIFGASNGAGFAMLMAERHPDRFGNILAFSVAGWGPDPDRVEYTQPVRFYLLAGTLEPRIHGLAELWLATLQNIPDVEVVFRDRAAGHDLLFWLDEMPAAMIWLFADR